MSCKVVPELTLNVACGSDSRSSSIRHVAQTEPRRASPWQTSLVRPYIRDPELKRAEERYEAGDVEVVVVKLEPCASDDDPFLGTLQRLAGDFESITDSNPRSRAWEQVRLDLKPVIERVRKKKKKTAKR